MSHSLGYQQLPALIELQELNAGDCERTDQKDESRST
ncbi:MAG: hypothetical protein JWN00_3987 [Actinomycetia bacterium]|jgi:hypothetical protein|nr:hypothetical protein [Actinomycetes bacterium]